MIWQLFIHLGLQLHAWLLRVEEDKSLNWLLWEMLSLGLFDGTRVLIRRYWTGFYYVCHGRQKRLYKRFPFGNIDAIPIVLNTRQGWNNVYRILRNLCQYTTWRFLSPNATILKMNWKQPWISRSMMISMETAIAAFAYCCSRAPVWLKSSIW